MSTEQIPPDIAAFSGPLLLGHLFNWGLFGALTVQVYIYYLSFPFDKKSAKILVGCVYVIEVIQTMLATHDAFGALGSGWGHPEALRDPQWLWFSVPIMSGLISCTVQCFLAWRIYLFSHNRISLIVLPVLALTQGTAAIVQGVQALKIGDFSKLQDEAFVSAAIWLGGSALCDILIASGMTFYLLKAQSGFKDTQVLLSKLVRLTIETGFITATVASVDLILFLRFRNNNFHICPALTLAKFYSNNLLVVFNSRVRIVDGRGSGGHITASIEDTFTQSVSQDKPLFGRRNSRAVYRNDAANKAGRFGSINVEITREFATDNVQMENIHPIKISRESSTDRVFEDDSKTTV